MEEIYEKHAGKPDEPHRHDFYTILFIKSARGKHIIDFHEFELGYSQAFFISPGQVHQLLEEEKSIGYSMVFSTQFLAENNIPLSFIEDLNLFNDYGMRPPLEIKSEDMSKLEYHCEEMLKFYGSSDKFRMQALGSQLRLFLIYCNSICSIPIDHTQNQEAANSIFKRCKSLVEEYFKREHSTSWYAAELAITPDHLNKAIRSLIGKTAKEYIQSRIIIAAKRLLYFTDLSNKEVGYELGFKEAANFSAFFKKCTGRSPSDFKKDMS